MVRGIVIALCCAGVALAGAAQAATVGYWRMEQDTDGGSGLAVPNEVAGGSALTAGNARIEADVPVASLPLGNVANTGAVDGNANVSGTVAHYAALDTDSVTVEFYARTNEGDAGFFTRAAGSNGKNFGTSGVAVVAPNSVDASYFVSDGGGGSTQETFTDLINMNSTWRHLALTYDAATGVGQFYIDGVVVATKDGPDNRPLVWGAGVDARFGWDLDGGGGLSGTQAGLMDELRISSEALSSGRFLNNSGAPGFAGIAKDSFYTTESGGSGTYDDGERLFSNGNNNVATVGTVGFSAAQPWQGGSTSNFELDNDGPANLGLEHNLLSGEMQGALRIKAKDSRHVERPLSAAVPVSDRYFMSALLHATKTEDNTLMSVGFGDSGNNRDSGFYVGFDDDGISAFAGGQTMNILGSYAEDMTYLVVLEMAVDAGGQELLSAYLAADGSQLLAPAFQDVPVESFDALSDLGWLKFKVDGNGVSSDLQWWMDEVRLATTMEGLGLVREVPEPATLALLGLAACGLGGYVRKRRQA